MFDIEELMFLKKLTGKKAGKNLFDEANAPIYGKYIAMQSQALTSGDWMQSDSGKTFSMEVKPNTDYAISAFNESITILRVLCMDVDPSTLGPYESYHSENVKSFGTARTGTIKTGANEKWIVIQVNGTNVTARNAEIQVEYGTAKTEPYEPYQS